MTQEVVRFCAQCGSCLVAAPEIVGANSFCGSCGWEGDSDKLLAVPITHEFSGKEEMIVSLMNDLRNIIAGKSGKSILHVLLKWGFVSPALNDEDTKQFSRYLASMCHAWMLSIVETRAKIEKERAQSRINEHSDN